MSLGPNLTDPDNPPKWFETKKASTKYKEDVTAALIKLDVPFRVAELAVIDIKYMVVSGYHKKQKPNITANLMMDMINRIYKDEDGTWHYTAPIVQQVQNKEL